MNNFLVIVPLLAMIVVMIGGFGWQQFKLNKAAAISRHRMNMLTLTREERIIGKDWM